MDDGPAAGDRRALIGHRRTVALLAAGLAGILGAAIGGQAFAASPTPAQPKVTFTVGLLQDVDSMNPFTGIAAASYEVWQTMYDTLTTTSAEDFSPVPALATKWTTSADGLTWTYTIRTGVKWSDGVPLTAKDVAYSFNRVMKGEYEQTNFGSYVANITSVTAPDDATVVMKTKVPSPIMTRLAVYILPEHIWSKVSEAQVKSYQNEKAVVGSGPFVLTERKNGQFTRLTTNPTYWGGPAKIDELVFRVYANADAMAQALKKGEIDFADGLSADVWESLKNTPGVKAYAGKYSGFNEIAFNGGAALDDGTPVGNGSPALKDKRVRQALNYAVDRKTIVERALNGTGTEGSSIIPPVYADLHYQPETPYTFDLAKAGQLLDAAGYPKGADGKRVQPNGKPLTLRLFARQESSSSQQSSRLVAGWFGQLGIPVTLDVVSEDTITERIGQGDYDMFEWGWVVEPDPDYQLSTFTCAKRSYKDGGQVYANLSDSFYCNPEYDRLYEQQSHQIDPAQRAATVKKMQQLLYDDAVYAVTFYYDNLEAYSTKWTGFVAQTPPDGVLLFQYGTWSYQSIQLASTAAGNGGSDDDSGGSSLILIGGIVAIAAAAGAIAAVFWRRRQLPQNAMDVE
jgi:peptide/nickel transport system substrate-binding protein